MVKLIWRLSVNLIYQLVSQRWEKIPLQVARDEFHVAMSGYTWRSGYCDLNKGKRNLN